MAKKPTNGEAAPKRKAISKTVRFEVFKRDSFACQYCGSAAPNALLRIDHIHPVAKGGTDDITNLITACQDCNAGKSDKLLSDKSALEKQRRELELLQERREQLDMMRQWRDSCASVKDEEVKLVESVFVEEFAMGFAEPFAKKVRKMIREYSLGVVLEASQKCCEYYEDCEIAMTRLKTFCQSAIADKELPGSGRIPYIVAVLKNRNISCFYRAADMVRFYLELGGDIQNPVEWAKKCRNWTQFELWMEVATNELQSEGVEPDA